MASIDGKLITPNTLGANRLKDAAGILRSQMAQVPNAPRAISVFEWRKWDTGEPLPVTAATDDLAVIAGTWARTISRSRRET